jgi:hypothetical protein
VERPVLEVRLGSEPGGAGDPFAVYRESVGPVVDALARDAPGLSVRIVDGTLDLRRDDGRLVALSKLTAEVDVAAAAIDARMSAAADLWREAEGRLRIAPGSLAGTATLEVRGWRAGALLEAVSGGEALAVHPGAVDVRLDIETDGGHAGRATIDASSPQLALAHGARRLELGAVRLAVEAEREANGLTIALRRLELGALLPRVTGSLRAKADGTAPAMDLTVADVDLARLREGILALAGDVEAVRTVTAVVRGGMLRSLELTGAGPTLAALAGAIRPTAVRVEHPVLEVRLGPGGGGAGEPVAAYRAAAGPVVDALIRKAPGLSARIVDGTLDVVRAGRRVAALSKLAAALDVAPDAVAVRASSASDRWRSAEARLRIVPGSLAGTAALDVRGWQAEALLEAMGSDAALAVRPGALDVRLEVETDGRRAGATIDLSSPRLALARGPRRLELGAVRLAAELAQDPSALTVALRRLELGDVLAGATGALRAKADGAAPAFELEVPLLALARLRERALVLAGDVEGVRAAAALVRGGTLRALRIASAGATLAALTGARAVRAEAGLDGGEVAVPDLGITVKEGRGALAFAAGTLRGRDLAGRIGTSSFRDGALALDLVPRVLLQDMRAAVDTDLAEALALARRTLEPAGVAALADIQALAGRAAGSFVFERPGGQPRHRLELTSVRAHGRHRGVPLPLAVSAGEVHSTPDRLSVRGLSGTIGRSRLTGASAELSLEGEGTLHAASGEAVLELGELFPWLASLDRLRSSLKPVRSLTGTATLRLARASGPLDNLPVLDFEVAVRPREVRAVLPELPAPLTLSGGDIRLTGAALELDRVGAVWLDAHVTASGRVEGYAAPDRRVDLALADGAAGARTSSPHRVSALEFPIESASAS